MKKQPRITRRDKALRQAVMKMVSDLPPSWDTENTIAPIVLAKRLGIDNAPIPAIHEASHAVIADTLGLSVKAVSVAGRHNGNLYYGGITLVKDRARKAFRKNGPRRCRSRYMQSLDEKSILFSLAGVLGERAYLIHRLRCKGDLGKAQDLETLPPGLTLYATTGVVDVKNAIRTASWWAFDRIPMSPYARRTNPIECYLKALERKAWSLVRRHFNRISFVAGRLNPSLEGYRLTEVLRNPYV